MDGIFYLQFSDGCSAQCVWRTVLCIDRMDHGFHAQLLDMVFTEKYFFVKVFKADKYISHSIIMCMLFITVQCMAGRVEAFYWYAGAANYMLIHSLSLFFFGVLIAAVYDRGKRRIADLVLASILGFLVGGGNQMTALNVTVIMLVVIGFGVVLKKWKEYKLLLIPIAFSLLGFILNVAAPGNWIRAEGTNGMNPLKSCFHFLFIIVWIIVLISGPDGLLQF